MNIQSGTQDLSNWKNLHSWKATAPSFRAPLQWQQQCLPSPPGGSLEWPLLFLLKVWKLPVAQTAQAIPGEESWTLGVFCENIGTAEHGQNKEPDL